VTSERQGGNSPAACQPGRLPLVSHGEGNSAIPVSDRHEIDGTTRGSGAWDARLYRDHTTLKDLWRQLERIGCCTPFQTYDWVSAWYETVAPAIPADPLIVVVWCDQDPAAILPLCVYRHKGLKVVSFPDFGVSDYSAPVFTPRSVQTPQQARAMMAAVLKTLPPCDLVQFHKVTERVDGQPNPLLWLEGVQRSSMESFSVVLRKDWSIQAEESMDRPLLSTIRRRRAQIAKAGDVIYDRVSDPALLNPLWDVLAGMRRERFSKLGRYDILADPVWQRFYQALLTQPDRSLDASITHMMISGETIASCFGITRRGTYYMLIPAFRMGRWEHYMPGMLLFYQMIESQATSGGCRFDFTIGDEGYKLRFGAERCPLHEWWKPRSAKGALSYGIWRAKSALRKRPYLLEFLRRIRSGFQRPN